MVYKREPNTEGLTELTSVRRLREAARKQQQPEYSPVMGTTAKAKESQEYGVKGMKWGQRKGGEPSTKDWSARTAYGEPTGKSVAFLQKNAPTAYEALESLGDDYMDDAGDDSKTGKALLNEMRPKDARTAASLEKVFRKLSKTSGGKLGGSALDILLRGEDSEQKAVVRAFGSEGAAADKFIKRIYKKLAIYEDRS